MDDIDWGVAVDEGLKREGYVGYHEQTWPQTNWSLGYSSGNVDEIDTLAGGDGPYVPHPKLEGRETEEQGVQTDDWIIEREVNTEPNWELMMQKEDECSTLLAKQYEGLLKQQKDEEAEHGRHVDSLKQKKEDGKRQQQVLLDKIESLQVKLQLNCSKTTRKNFAVKKQELNAEKTKIEEDKNKLSQELEDINRKLTLHKEEQSQEKQTWEQELSELNREMEGLQKEAEAANIAAMRDEMAAVEVQREVVMSQVEDWLKEAKHYIDNLRMDPSQHHNRVEWERTEALVLNCQADLQNQFTNNLQLLRQGQRLENLPQVILPSLPQIPTLDLVISQMMFSAPRPTFQLFHMGAPNNMGMPFAPQHHPRPSFTAPARVTPPPAPSPTPPLSVAPPSGPNLPMAPPTAQPAPQPLPTSNPPQAGKLDKLLDKLGARFPQSSRAQLMSVLQQIKMSRGTMAGMSMEEVTQQVAQRMAQSERGAQGPTRPPTAARGFPGPQAPIQCPPGHIQRPMLPQQRPAVAQVFHTRPPQPATHSTRKLCLMCQNQVETGSQHPMSCTHTIHKECIRVWLQSSKNNSCPFCPTK